MRRSQSLPESPALRPEATEQRFQALALAPPAGHISHWPRNVYLAFITYIQSPCLVTYSFRPQLKWCVLQETFILLQSGLQSPLHRLTWPLRHHRPKTNSVSFPRLEATATLPSTAAASGGNPCTALERVVSGARPVPQEHDWLIHKCMLAPRTGPKLGQGLRKSY